MPLHALGGRKSPALETTAGGAGSSGVTADAGVGAVTTGAAGSS